MLNVVVLNGGRGAATLIPVLIEHPEISITSVVNAYDDGKSTGEIRKFFNMLGPSDIRKVQELMLPKNDPDYDTHIKIFQYRYPIDVDRNSVLKNLSSFISEESDGFCECNFESKNVVSELRKYLKEFLSHLFLEEKIQGVHFNFSDCSIMNCIYAGAFLLHQRNIEVTTNSIDKLFKLQGTVLPTSLEDKKLMALRENGEVLYTEAEIVELRSNVKIERIYLVDQVPIKTNFENLSISEKRLYLEKRHCYVGVSPQVCSALSNADIIIYASGTQHSSLYPTYLSVGLAAGIADNFRAKKFFITNIGADYETPSYKASDFIHGAFRYLKLSDNRRFHFDELFNYIFVNDSSHRKDTSYVKFDKENFIKLKNYLILHDFEDHNSPGKHDGAKLVEMILRLY
jgi:2-phospho-L-lactate transferase/gluconeogenesis factor (CofD/UPF0052 family)